MRTNILNEDKSSWAVHVPCIFFMLMQKSVRCTLAVNLHTWRHGLNAGTKHFEMFSSQYKHNLFKWLSIEVWRECWSPTKWSKAHLLYSLLWLYVSTENNGDLNTWSVIFFVLRCQDFLKSLSCASPFESSIVICARLSAVLWSMVLIFPYDRGVMFFTFLA